VLVAIAADDGDDGSSSARLQAPATNARSAARAIVLVRIESSP
jgi:hypothetical protein